MHFNEKTIGGTEILWQREDNTYNETRERAVLQWLDEIETHEDLVVRDGVRVTRDYILYLKKKIDELESLNKQKDTFLKRLKKEKMELKAKLQNSEEKTIF